MSPRGRNPLPTPEAGFVLPGVIMFVLVLTILGFSLFALSGYEAQFLNTSLDQSEAFYAANGGVDRARYLLASTQLLESVAANLGTEVDSAGASQGGRISGPVDWGITADPVIIRVKASKNSHSRVVEAQFSPNNLEPYDKLFRLFAPDKGLEVSTAAPLWYPNDATDLNGVLWQNFQAPGWEDYFQTDLKRLYPGLFRSPNLVYEQGEAVPAAQVQPFIAQNPGKPGPAYSPNWKTIALDASANPDRVGLFLTKRGDGQDNSLDPNFSLYITGPDVNGQGSGGDIDVNVSGRVVWMFDSGFRCDHTLRVHGTPNDMLVLCARPQTNGYPPDDDVGIWLEGGIDSPNGVPVILVSDGAVKINSNPAETSDGDLDATVGWLNVFASRAWIRGPHYNPAPNPPPNYYHLLHVYHPVPSSAAVSLSLQRLIQHRALPNAAGNRRYLAYRPGTWQDLSNPN